MSTATAPIENAEARELSLVGKVELRIALADSDTKLGSILQTYLPPLLLKLASSHLSVRNKVSLGRLDILL
jgi:proteasome component ECM29